MGGLGRDGGLVALLADCNSTLLAEKPDPTSGLYATHTVLKPADVRVPEKFDPAYSQMVYLKINADNRNPRL